MKFPKALAEIDPGALAGCPKLKDSPDPEAVQMRKAQKMIEEERKKEEEYLRKEEQFRREMIIRLFK